MLFVLLYVYLSLSICTLCFSRVLCAARRFKSPLVSTCRGSLDFSSFDHDERDPPRLIVRFLNQKLTKRTVSEKDTAKPKRVIACAKYLQQKIELNIIKFNIDEFDFA